MIGFTVAKTHVWDTWFPDLFIITWWCGRVGYSSDGLWGFQMSPTSRALISRCRHTVLGRNIQYRAPTDHQELFIMAILNFSTPSNEPGITKEWRTADSLNALQAFLWGKSLVWTRGQGLGTKKQYLLILCWNRSRHWFERLDERFPRSGSRRDVWQSNTPSR